MINVAYNMDCMEAMRRMPDKCFDLAVVDPPYGGGSPQSVHVERERETGLRGGAADFERRRRSRFGGRFDKYYIGDSDRRNLVDEVSDAHRGYL